MCSRQRTCQKKREYLANCMKYKFHLKGVFAIPWNFPAILAWNVFGPWNMGKKLLEKLCRSHSAFPYLRWFWLARPPALCQCIIVSEYSNVSIVSPPLEGGGISMYIVRSCKIHKNAMSHWLPIGVTPDLQVLRPMVKRSLSAGPQRPCWTRSGLETCAFPWRSSAFGWTHWMAPKSSPKAPRESIRNGASLTGFWS